jgi:hypothetical protein
MRAETQAAAGILSKANARSQLLGEERYVWLEITGCFQLVANFWDHTLSVTPLIGGQIQESRVAPTIARIQQNLELKRHKVTIQTGGCGLNKCDGATRSYIPIDPQPFSSGRGPFPICQVTARLVSERLSQVRGQVALIRSRKSRHERRERFRTLAFFDRTETSLVYRVMQINKKSFRWKSVSHLIEARDIRCLNLNAAKNTQTIGSKIHQNSAPQSNPRNMPSVASPGASSGGVLCCRD